jgi:hypothetical protein
MWRGFLKLRVSGLWEDGLAWLRVAFEWATILPEPRHSFDFGLKIRFGRLTLVGD